MTQILWGSLKTRAEHYFEISNSIIIAGKVELTQNALENMHLALELSMKATINKNGGAYPDYGKRGHNLEELVVCRFGDGVSCILSEAKKNKAHAIFNVGLSAWSMDCRYITMENLEDMKASINDYKELYIWIKNNLLK